MTDAELQSFQVRMEESPLRGLDLQHQLTRLRQGRKMPAAEVQLIYRTLNDRVQTHEQVVAVRPFPSSATVCSYS